MSFSGVTQPMYEDLAGQEQPNVGYSLETESHRQKVGGWYLNNYAEKSRRGLSAKTEYTLLVPHNPSWHTKA